MIISTALIKQDTEMTMVLGLRLSDKSEESKKSFSSFLDQNICCWYSKEPSQLDGSFEHQKHIFRLFDKKRITILCKTFLLIQK